MSNELRPTRLLFVLIAFLLATIFAGCGGGGETTSSPPPTPSGVVRLQWDSNSEPDMDHYLVYYDIASRSAKPYPNPAKSVPKQVGGTTSYDLTGLVPGQRYYVRISAVDNSGSESALSSEADGIAK